MKIIENTGGLKENLKASLAMRDLRLEKPCIDYDLDKFNLGYTRYFGCGHHLYIFVGE